ncbi:MAG: hypothetical protein ACHREM_04055, partial [Polyangiales bacterium]
MARCKFTKDSIEHLASELTVLQRKLPNRGVAGHREVRPPFEPTRRYPSRGHVRNELDEDLPT